MHPVFEVVSPEEKRAISREILEALPEWFGIPEARENYIAESAHQLFFCARGCAHAEEKALGFLCLKETGKATVELAVMGVLKEFYRQGIGSALVKAAREHAARAGYSFLQVKTVQMGHYPEYDATNRFYLRLGFEEFDVLPTLWDEWNPCQIYVMSLKS